MNSYQSEFVLVSCNYPLSHQYGTSVVKGQTSLSRNVPSGEIEAPRNGCIRRLPPWGYSQPYPLEVLKKTFLLRIIWSNKNSLMLLGENISYKYNLWTTVGLNNNYAIMHRKCNKYTGKLINTCR